MLVVVALVIVAACSGRDLMVDGGGVDDGFGGAKNVCQQYASAFKACVDALDCSIFTDATEKAICDAMKSAGTGTGTGAPVPCDGAVKEAAEKALTAGLDKLCMPRTANVDRTVACNHFADFINACTANCIVTWDCEAYFGHLPVDDQITFDDCSDCLASNLAAGVCADCHDSHVGSCQSFMEALLGVDCW